MLSALRVDVHTPRRRAIARLERTKIDALLKFVLTLVTTRNTLSAEAVASVKEAGYSDRQILEAILAISAILFTNMFNRVNDTVLDFPKAA